MVSEFGYAADANGAAERLNAVGLVGMGVVAAVEAESTIQWLVVGDSGSGCGGGSAMVVRSCVRWISCEMDVKAKHDVRRKEVDTSWDLDFFDKTVMGP